MKIDPHTFLKEELKADTIPHNNKTLYEHLSKVEKLLRICDYDDDTCLAGLFHSVYGTSIFNIESTNDRKIIKEVIGEKAEKLVFIFSKAKRPFCWSFGSSIPLINGSFIVVDAVTLHKLQSIETANMLEQKLDSGILNILKFVSGGLTPQNIANPKIY